MRPISSEKILGALETQYLRLTTLRGQNNMDPEFCALMESLYTEFRSIIADQGILETPDAMRSLCKTLDEVQADLAPDHPSTAEFLRRLDKIRRTIRRTLEEEAGWRQEPIVKAGKPTAAGLLGLNLARSEMGLAPLSLHGNEYLTAEEQRASLAIASILGEVALADFWSATAPERFEFNDRTIQNLREWIRDIQPYSGNVVEDIPVALLTLPSLRCLRELLFAALRDQYYSNYYKDSVQGVDPVLTALTELRMGMDETARQMFIDELVDYFIDLDNMPIPTRLKPGLGKGEEFPGKHQKIAMKEIERQRQLLLADPTGGGKTGSCIAAFERLRDEGKAKRMLILCPSGITGEWEKRLTDVNGGYFRNGQKPRVAVIRPGDESKRNAVAGDAKASYDRKQEWENAKTADYVIMSIEMAREQTDGIHHVDRARDIGADFFVVDEAHNVRNPEGQDTERIFQISQCESIQSGYTVASTATPVYNTIEDVAAQVRLLNAGQDRLKDAEGIPAGIDFADIRNLTRTISHNHTRLVRNLLKLRMLRRVLNDCLPTGTELIEHPPVETPLSPIEQEIYDAVLEMPFFEIAMDKIRALERACTHGAPDDPNSSIIGATKLLQIEDAVVARVERQMASPHLGNNKIVLGITSQEARGVTRDWSNNNSTETSAVHTYLIGRLRERLKERVVKVGGVEQKGIAVFILDGSNTGSKPLRDGDGNIIMDIDGAPMTKTRKMIADFRNHDGPAVLAVRTDIGGEGIDMSFANQLLFESPSTVRSGEIQQIGRENRKGQKYDVEVQHLILGATIERGKWEFARRKQRIIEDLLDGRPLSHMEIDILYEETRSVRRGGYLAYEAMTPRQKVTHLFNRMFNQGKDRVREILESDGGRYARELAMLYRQVEDLGTQGNNRRLLLGLLQKHAPDLMTTHGNQLEVADIAAGTMGIARALQNDDRYSVWSSDISKVMMEAGSDAMPNVTPQERMAECPMDELPYASGSKHVAFLSLALDCTRHNARTAEKGNGGERVRTLLQLNRVLCDRGMAFIGLHRSLFQDADAFAQFTDVIQQYFGFTVIEGDTGFAKSVDHPDEEEFEGAVITLTKTGNPRALHEQLPMEAWLALNFWKKAVTARADGERFLHTPGQKPPPPPGAFHEKFSIGSEVIAYEAPSTEHEEKMRHHDRKKNYKSACASIQRLLDKHGSVRAIPPEELLSLSLQDISTDTQALRDAYFQTLLEKHDGKIETIPLNEISRESPVILHRMYDKKIGWYLVLATIDPRTKKLGTYGKKYFLEDEFVRRQSNGAPTHRKEVR